MSRSWLRPRIFNHQLNHISYAEDRHCTHIHIERERDRRKSIDNEKESVLNKKIHYSHYYYDDILSFFLFFLFFSYLLWSLILYSIIQLLYIRSSTKINIYLRRDRWWSRQRFYIYSSLLITCCRAIRWASARERWRWKFLVHSHCLNKQNWKSSWLDWISLSVCVCQQSMCIFPLYDETQIDRRIGFCVLLSLFLFGGFFFIILI